ncbi:ATP-dependent RNA helicase eIF4A-like isoform X2 [Harmonia axyridis]|uniref:ATP-dependent RNA helicase eIF4A-like isoform X2 n=1 Tax=Harmonia axyridis TaxID=115357 RepID=UPI001E27638F|nr:ATP-dependent RNA helicase eIF4A-like isoform X2 [Harmonia axyridis]
MHHLKVRHTRNTLYLENKAFAGQRISFYSVTLTPSIRTIELVMKKKLSDLVQTSLSNFFFTFNFALDFETLSTFVFNNKLNNFFLFRMNTHLKPCGVCAQVTNENFFVGKCLHIFHKKCLSNESTCPECKIEMGANLVEGECGICLEPLEKEVLITKCRHAFHYDCILKWASTSGNCPYCRSLVEVKDIAGETEGETDSSSSHTDFSDTFIRNFVRNYFHFQRTGAGASLIICTDSLARGIDLPGIEYVFSYSAPKHLKTYIHRAGRTARAGCLGTAVTLLHTTQVGHFKSLLEHAGKTNIEESVFVIVSTKALENIYP